MTIYLYKKTHNVTGLKYLGKTISSDPDKYKGSGNIWISHIKKHGYNVTTEILKECENIEELKFWGLYYSELWDIVNARDSNGKKIWANLKPEEGDGGVIPGAAERMSKLRKGQSPWNKGLKTTDESKEKNRLSHVGKVTSDTTKQKQRTARLGKITSNETKDKLRELKLGTKWWNNGVKCIMTRENPGPGWTPGKIKHNY